MPRKTTKRRTTRRKKKDAGLLGVGLASAAIGALGAYFIYGTDKGKTNRSKIKGWMLKAKGEVLDEVEKLKAVDAKQYDRIAKKVLAKYKKLKSVSAGEFKTLTTDINKAWKTIAKEATTVRSKPKKKTTRRKTAKRKK